MLQENKNNTGKVKIDDTFASNTSRHSAFVDKMDELPKNTRESKFLKKISKNLNFRLSDFKIDRSIPEKTIKLINALVYNKKVEDEDLKVSKIILLFISIISLATSNISITY